MPDIDLTPIAAMGITTATCQSLDRERQAFLATCPLPDAPTGRLPTIAVEGVQVLRHLRDCFAAASGAEGCAGCHQDCTAQAFGDQELRELLDCLHQAGRWLQEKTSEIEQLSESCGQQATPRRA